MQSLVVDRLFRRALPRKADRFEIQASHGFFQVQPWNGWPATFEDWGWQSSGTVENANFRDPDKLPVIMPTRSPISANAAFASSNRPSPASADTKFR
jgi:hypothetical protein